ncbi:lactose permease [Penicillium brasilianum]|uniref:Lactose permease n=1 Tax=Penicillium brasilianum TaxID=104259 RepID=A0A1S9RNG5_PENBI|nr:lactose permease [Penicillium brasilianum]
MSSLQSPDEEIKLSKGPLEKIAIHDEGLPTRQALLEALKAERPSPWSPNLRKLYVFCLIAFLCSSMNGYDGSIFGSLPALDSFRKQFGVQKNGSKIGYISAMYTVGAICSLPFSGPACDIRGRKWGTFIGCIIVVACTFVSATARGVPQFVAGRFFLGFGVNIVRSTSSIWCAEVCPPAYRGIIMAFYNCTYAVGSLIAAGVTRGSAGYEGNKSWQIPLWCQMICPGIVLLTVLFFPESPRWLFSHGKEEKAWEFLAYYHGEGNRDHPLVQLQLQEYREFISLSGSDKRWWDFSDFYKTKAGRWRFINALITGIWGQCSGNAVVTYYLPAMLLTTGITQSEQVLNVNLGYTVVSTVASYLGATQIERMGRRPTIIWTAVACSICFACITIGSGLYAHTHAPPAASAGIAFIFIFGFCYNFGMTPLQALYPVEALSYETRGKGVGLTFSIAHLFTLLNQFCFPVALQKIGWYTYIVFIAWDLFEATVSYFVSVETKNHTLEELTEIFESPNPVKASLQKPLR